MLVFLLIPQNMLVICDGLGTLRILEAVRILGLEKKTRIYQASTSELYGGMPENKNEKGFYDENSQHFIRDRPME